MHFIALLTLNKVTGITGVLCISSPLESECGKQITLLSPVKKMNKKVRFVRDEIEKGRKRNVLHASIRFVIFVKASETLFCDNLSHFSLRHRENRLCCVCFDAVH